jgi:predicted SprT family Zn-dependent metalloprotease
MLSQDDQLRARFAANDRVTFNYRRKLVEGVLIRTNPSRALVRVGEEEFTVPYANLGIDESVARQRQQRIESFHEMALQTMRNHGLSKWRFQFDHSTRRAGCCNYHDRLISISFDLARNGSDADIRDTILHEIAHALVGKKHNHDAVWKAKAKKIGCSGERTHRLELAPPRYHVRCENDCWTHTAQRKTRRLVCRTCGGKLVYSTYV